MSKVDEHELPDLDKLWDFSRPRHSEQSFRNLIHVSKNQKDLDYYCELLTQIARALGMQARFLAAHETLNEVRDLLKPTFGQTHVRYFLERGRLYSMEHDESSAVYFFNEAFNIAKEEGLNFLAIDAANMLRICEPKEKQIFWLETALDLAQKSKDNKSKSWLPSLYNSIGWIYFDLKQYKKSYAHLMKSLEANERFGNKNTLMMARWSVAKVLRFLNKQREALKILEDLEQEYEKFGSPDGFVFEELAEVHLQLKNNIQAKKYFSKAHTSFLALDTIEKERIQRIAHLIKTL